MAVGVREMEYRYEPERTAHSFSIEHTDGRITVVNVAKEYVDVLPNDE